MALTVQAAGGVVVRPAADGGIEILVVHRPKYDDWSLPKGKLDPGEAPQDAAVREVREETGWRCAVVSELPTIRYRDGDGNAKTVRYWKMTPVEFLGFVPGDEVDRLRWIRTADATRLLSYEADRRLVRHLLDIDVPWSTST